MITAPALGLPKLDRPCKLGQPVAKQLDVARGWPACPTVATSLLVRVTLSSPPSLSSHYIYSPHARGMLVGELTNANCHATFQVSRM